MMLKEFGQDLKKLRELKGISIAEISAESRINPKFLSNIENGNFDFQPEAYIRSFIKAFARALDENENQMLNEYDKAKAGFYARRKFAVDETKDVTPPEPKISIVTEQPNIPSSSYQSKTEEPVYSKGLQNDKPDYFKAKEAEPEKKFSGRSITQKVMIGLIIVGVLTGIYFLVDYLNTSGQKKSDVKPKTFNEMSNEYENKINGKKDSAAGKDSTQLVAGDSLKLMIKALKDLTFKVYVDENKLVEGDIIAKDSVMVTAKDQFRFSSTTNLNVELYLNGKYIRKPATLSGSSIKNLVIKKDGISQ
jgi:cytoskeletal protein RodZ